MVTCSKLKKNSVPELNLPLIFTTPTTELHGIEISDDQSMLDLDEMNGVVIEEPSLNEKDHDYHILASYIG